jgi:hypothetical protein
MSAPVLTTGRDRQVNIQTKKNRLKTFVKSLNCGAEVQSTREYCKQLIIKRYCVISKFLSPISEGAHITCPTGYATAFTAQSSHFCDVAPDFD